MNVLVPIEKFMYGKLQAFRLRLKEISHFYIKWPNANSSFLARISLLGIRFELRIPMYPQDGTNLSHCAINNNSGPGINSPTSHQNPGFRGPIVLVPLPTDDWQPRAERVTAGGRSQAGLNPTWLASASIQSSRSAGAASIRVVNQVNITRQWQVP